jgi:hypothetical protein
MAATKKFWVEVDDAPSRIKHQSLPTLHPLHRIEHDFCLEANVGGRIGSIPLVARLTHPLSQSACSRKTEWFENLLESILDDCVDRK